MTGHLDKAGHSWNMSRIRGKDTNPEIAVRENVRKSSPTPSGSQKRVALFTTF